MTDQQKEEIVSIAKGLLGKPYKYGAKPEEAPDFFDCSSFVQYLFKQIGIEIPRISIDQAADPQGGEVFLENNFDGLELGDLIFMRGVIGRYQDDLFPTKENIYVGHVGIYSGNGRIIHARGGVIQKVDEQKLEGLTKDPKYRIVLVKRYSRVVKNPKD